ncbi:MAG: aminopeptidase P family protein [Oscillospiraceae bacterium]|nr:aminopeptidase P family protein [Oscillospiraceae bacterium]
MNKIEILTDTVLENDECFIVSNDVNRFYLTGFKSSAGFIVGFKGVSYFLVDFRYIEKARSTVKNCVVLLLNSDFFPQLNRLITEHKVKRVLLEAYNTTLFAFDTYKQKIKDAEISPDTRLSETLAGLRILKTECEIEKIISAQRIAEKAFDDVLNTPLKGKTEIEVARLLENRMYEQGAEAISFETIVLSGENSSMPHGVPTKKPIGDGFLLFDFGAVYDGYHSDMSRTIFFGEPSELEKNVYDIVLTAQIKALNAVSAGIDSKTLDRVARDYISQSGYGEFFGHSLGHGVGLEIHEEPAVSEKSNYTLQEGNVITIEPGIYLPGQFGVRIEDFVYVTHNGYVNITKQSKELMTF